MALTYNGKDACGIVVKLVECEENSVGTYELGFHGLIKIIMDKNIWVKKE
jgi:hypothetical protein